jgi:quinoprotein glucose dehydrogenase
VPALIQPTKLGHVFVLHRETGAPLFPVEERAVPTGDVPEETYAPTQPFPTFPRPLHPHRLAPEDAFGFTPWDRARCRRRLAALRNDGLFTPPSLQGSLSYPGTPGGANWGGAAFDPERKLLVLNQSRIAMTAQLVPRAMADPEARGQFMGVSPQAGTPYAVAQDVPVSPFGVPCSPPPWGTLLAVDFATGDVRWEVPFGTTRDMTPIPIGLPLGLPSMGGPLATASGLVFIGAALDDYLRAYDIETGEELWRARLPAGGQANPITYRLRPESRQLVVLAAGGHGTLGTTPGDWVIAWALP